MSLIIGLVILGLDVWAVMNVWGSGAMVLAKLLWTIDSIPARSWYADLVFCRAQSQRICGFKPNRTKLGPGLIRPLPETKV